MRRMQYRAQSLCQQRLEITGPSLGDQSPALRRGLRRPFPGLFYPQAWMRW
jgi:hypothetical protein